MLKNTMIALGALFAAAAANAQSPDEAERQRLQIIYDAVESKDKNGIQSHVIFLPLTKDHDAMAATIAKIVKDKFDATIPEQMIKDRVFDRDIDMSAVVDAGIPLGVTATIHGPQVTNFACFTFLPPANLDMKKDILASIGYTNYTGNNGTVYDGSSPDNPYEYSFNISISPEAWRSYKTHLAAANCLVDLQNNPALAGAKNDDETNNAIINAATGFAAVMAARDGHPEILPFLADYIAATVHNPGNYTSYYVHTLLTDPANLANHSKLGSMQIGGYQMNYPVGLLDNLTNIWNRGTAIQNAPTADLYPAILQLARQTAYGHKGEATLFDLMQPAFPPGDPMLDMAFQQKLLKRAEQGAKNLNLCVTYSKAWEAYGKNTGKDYWAERRQDIWTPPVCK